MIKTNHEFDQHFFVSLFLQFYELYEQIDYV